MANKFGKTIRNLRMVKEIGLREFARQIDITPAYLSNVERGEFKPPSEEVIIKMAKKLEMDSDFLLRIAKKISPDIENSLKQDKVIAEYAPAFFRLAKGFSEKDWQDIINWVKEKSKGE